MIEQPLAMQRRITRALWAGDSLQRSSPPLVAPLVLQFMNFFLIAVVSSRARIRNFQLEGD